MGCAGSTPGSSVGSEPVITRAESADAELDDTAVPQKELSPEMLKKVTDLFKEWDVKGNGMVPLSELSKASVSAGPAKSAVLGELKKMDFNGDGLVEESEWLTYFKTTGAMLSDDELTLILTELEESGSDIITVYRCTLMAAEAPTAPVEGDGEEEEPEGIPELPEARKAVIEKLFNTFNFAGTDQIEIAKVASASIELGPNQVSVCDNFAMMDTDGDKFVSREEMFTYFAITTAGLNDDEFTVVTDDMLALAESAAEVAKSLSLAIEMKNMGGATGEPVAPDDDEEAEAEEPPPELAGVRLAKVQELWAVFDPSDSKTPIELSVIEADCTSDIGPHKSTPLSSMKAMDLNGDGKIEYDEMLQYFRAVGAEMDEDTFVMIVDELVSSASNAATVKSLTALASS